MDEPVEISTIEKIKNLRASVAADSQEGRLLDMWVSGWSADFPLPFGDMFRDKESETDIFMEIFNPDTYPALLGRIVSCMEELHKSGHSNYTIHFSTCADWWREVPGTKALTEKLCSEFKTLKYFINEVAGGKAADKIFINIDGQYF